jgi:HEPN domain-containing protein
MPHTKAFRELLKNIEKEYVGNKVPPQYQKRYGKRYDKSEMKSLGYAIAKSRGIPIDKK